jgi:hypothetical protein
MRRTGLVLAAVALAAAPALLPSAEAAPPAYPTAVKDALQQSYVAQPYLGYTKGKPAQQNVEGHVAGTPLTLQATYVKRQAAEPTIGVDAKGRAFMTASARDSVLTNGVTSVPRTEIKSSSDGGLTWKNVTPELPVLKSLPPVTLDPMLWLDKKTGRLFNPELFVEGSYLQWTDDGGKTWTTSPLCCGNPVNDHQTFAGGPPAVSGPAPSGYPHVLYYCFNRVADSSCSRSINGGLSWTPTGLPAFSGACPDGGGHVDVGPLNGIASSALEGHLVVDQKGTVLIPAGHCGAPFLAISRDEGATWDFHQISEVYGTATDAGLTQNHLAVAVDEAGIYYFLWWTKDTLPLLSHSTDGGNSWSHPVMVAPPGVRTVNFPSIAAGKRGQVSILFPGAAQRWDYDAKSHDYSLPWNTYVITSLNADTMKPTFWSSTVNPRTDPMHRGPCQGRCGDPQAGMYDFLDIVYAPSGEIWAATVDDCTDLRGCREEGDENKSNAVDGQGLAVRQLAGAGLTAIPPELDHTGAGGKGTQGGSGGVAAPTGGSGGGLAATGPAVVVEVWALLLLVAALALRRSRRRMARATGAG